MTVSSQIIEVLNDLCTKFGVAINWSEENAWPYVQELSEKYISWEVATSWVWIFIGIIMILLAALAIWLDFKFDVIGALMAVAVILLFIAAPLICDQTFDIITCKHFPEKMIFDYVSAYLRNH